MSTASKPAVPREREWLDGAERAQLQEAVAAIKAAVERRQHDARLIGERLTAIRDARLYREHAATFEDFVKDTFGFSARRAYQLIEAAAITAAVCTTVHTPQPSERAARELAPFADDLQATREAWSEAVERHGPQPTAQQVRDIVRPAPEIVRPPMPPGDDLRFTEIEDAADSLRALPDPRKIAWPVEAGDVETLDAAFRFLAEWLPEARRSWSEHKRALREARKSERKLRAVA